MSGVSPASVSKLAREFLQGWKGAEEAALAGLLHDLGKYGDLFQARLKGEESGLDHWSAGARIALLEHRAIAAALAIEGHHIGLQAASKSAFASRLKLENLIKNHPLKLRLSDPDFEQLRTRANTESLTFETPAARLLELDESAWTPAASASAPSRPFPPRGCACLRAVSSSLTLMLILVAYDVSTETREGRRRLRRVAKVCQDYGQRVQKSVFEYKVDASAYEVLERRLLDEIDMEEDNLRLYRLNEPIGEHVKQYGEFRATDFDGPLVI